MSLKKLDHLWRHHLGVCSIGSLPAVVLGSSPEDHQNQRSGIVADFHKLPQLASTIWRRLAGFFSGIWKRQFGKPVEYFRGQTLRWYNKVTYIR